MMISDNASKPFHFCPLWLPENERPHPLSNARLPAFWSSAALDLANSGYYVYLLEKSPSIGGVMSQLDKTFPTNDCAM